MFFLVCGGGIESDGGELLVRAAQAGFFFGGGAE